MFSLTPKLLELCAVRRKLGTNLFCTDQSSAGMHILHGHPECTMGGSQKNSDWLLNIRHGWWQNDFFFCKTCKSNMAQYHGTGWTKTSRWNGLEILNPNHMWKGKIGSSEIGQKSLYFFFIMMASLKIASFIEDFNLKFDWSRVLCWSVRLKPSDAPCVSMHATPMCQLSLGCDTAYNWNTNYILTREMVVLRPILVFHR